MVILNKLVVVVVVVVVVELKTLKGGKSFISLKG